MALLLVATPQFLPAVTKFVEETAVGFNLRDQAYGGAWESPPPSHGIVAAIQVESLSLRDQAANVTLVLSLSAPEASKLRHHDTNAAVISCPSDDYLASHCTVNPSDTNDRVSVSMMNGGVTALRSITVSLSELLKGVEMTHVLVPITGASAMYPSDSYEIPFEVMIDSAEIDIREASLGEVVFAELPDFIASYRSQGDDQFATWSGQGDDQSVTWSGMVVSPQVSVTRPLHIKVLVYFLGIVLPALLIVGVLQLVGRARRGAADQSETFLAVVLVALSLLLMRPVIIPSAIESITYLDFSLAISVLIVLGLGLSMLIPARHQLQSDRKSV